MVISVCFVKLNIFLLEANNEDNSSEPTNIWNFPLKLVGDSGPHCQHIINPLTFQI